MKFYYFSEQGYYPVWDEIQGPLRTDPGSKLAEPAVAHRLLNRCIDEWTLADQLGMNIMVNEHHASYTCMSVSCMLTLSILARVTKNARLLALGVPLFNRPDPYRVAEEAAYVDTMSGGRLELGLVKGAGYELPISNQNPVRNMDRFWEAHDLLLKAFTSHDGPVSWESENYQYRNINVIPRCFQQPHPPIWMPTFSGNNAREIARRGYTMATFTTGYGSKGVFDAYRETFAQTHGRAAPPERIAYLGMVAVAKDEKTARERGARVASYAHATERTPPAKLNPPGYMSVADNARLLPNQGAISFFYNKTLPDGRKMSNPPTIDEFVQAGMLFCGTPDQVAEQIMRFSTAMGGVGNMIVQMGGMLEDEENRDSLYLFGSEVVPRLKELHLSAAAE